MDNSKMMDSAMMDSDVMMMSTNTYVVGRPFDSYNALDSSLLSELDMSNHNSVNTSMVLEHPLMDLNMLPIIGDDELETPIYIPNRTMSTTLVANQQKINNDKKPNANDRSTTATAASRVNGNPNPTPRFVPAPKKPTKNQLIYEKLKESMEKEKNKPKREVKSKVSESLKAFSAPKAISREPSALKPKSLTATSQIRMRPPASILRPTSTAQASTSKKAATSPSCPTPIRPNSIALRPKSDANIKLNEVGSKTQSSAKSLASKSSGALSQAAATDKRRQLLNEKLSMLRNLASHNGHGFVALAVLFAHLNKTLQQKTYDLACAHDEIFSTGKANDELKVIINSHIEQNSKTMDELNKNFDLILKEKAEDFESKIEFLKDQFQHQIGVLERQLAEEKERHKVVPVSLKSEEPNVCKGDCNDEIRSLNMTIQLKNEEIHALRGETRELELKNESLMLENKHIGALNSQLERMNQYVRQARENEKLLTKDLTTIQNELMDMKRKNVDLQQRLDIFHYKLGEDGEMATSTHSNSSGRSIGTRSVHEPVFSGDRTTPDRPHSNSGMTMSTPMVWSSVMRRTKPKISQDEIFDERGKIEFDENLSGTDEVPDGTRYASSESSKENNCEQ